MLVLTVTGGIVTLCCRQANSAVAALDLEPDIGGAQGYVGGQEARPVNRARCKSTQFGKKSCRSIPSRHFPDRFHRDGWYLQLGSGCPLIAIFVQEQTFSYPPSFGRSSRHQAFPKAAGLQSTQ
jgi:hypothetical protein